jgi:hypothetical protein
MEMLASVWCNILILFPSSFMTIIPLTSTTNALENIWLTQPMFCLSTTLIGMITVNIWKLADWHKILIPPY